MNPVAPGQQASELRQQLDRWLRVCIQCGLCLPYCATFLATGNEVQSPRGRLLLLQRIVTGQVAEDDPDLLRAFDLCLGCRACATACPSGIAFQLFDHAKDLAFTRLPGARDLPGGARLSSPGFLRWLRRGADLARSVLGACAGARWRERLEAARPAFLARWARLLGTVPRSCDRDSDLIDLLDGLVTVAQGRRAPDIAAGGEVLAAGEDPDPVQAAADETMAGEAATAPVVAFFRGCASAALLPGTSRRLRRLLKAAGCRVIVPAEQACCGALAGHTGQPHLADAQRQRNVAAFRAAQGEGSAADWDWMVVEAAGCGLELQGYPAEIADRVRDACVLLSELRLPRAREVPLRVALHDACHARHGQHIVSEPRRLLRRIPLLELLEPAEPEVCCGSGGAYSLQHPELSAAMGRRKAEMLAATDADLIVTTNPGCLGQIADGLALVAPELPIVPLTDLLWYAHLGERSPGVAGGDHDGHPGSRGRDSDGN